MANVQSNNRGSMQRKSLKKRRLFQAEVLQDIAESAGKASNQSLKTANEAAAADEVAEAIPDALD